MAYRPKTLWLNFPIFSFVTTKIPLQTKNQKNRGVPDFVFELRPFLIFCMKYSEKMKNVKQKNTITEIGQGQVLEYSREICGPWM